MSKSIDEMAIDSMQQVIDQLKSGDFTAVQLDRSPLRNGYKMTIDIMDVKAYEERYSRKKAPWPDYAGNDLYEGDTIRHPDGTKGKIVFVDGEVERTGSKNYGWKVDYGDLVRGTKMPYLGLQIDDKGHAVKV